ncbi:MAG: hypothetical protein ACYC6W_10470, partial [Nitrosotalea sp.]
SFTTATSGTTASTLNRPNYVAFDSAGNLWVADSNNNRILMYPKATPTAPANVIVQSGVVLTIPSGLRLNIDFTRYHLLVQYGGGVLVQAGGAIN